MKQLRKRAITLLETLIAIGLLALVATTVAFKVKQWIDEQRTLNEMSDVANLMISLQDLMLMANIDSTVSFEKSTQGLIMKVNPQSAIPYYLVPQMHQKPYHFKYIKEIQFEEGTTNMMRNPPLILSFISKGFLMNRGTLHLKSSNAQKKMLFVGYPAPLKLSGDPKLLLPIETENLNQNEQMTVATFEETK